MEVSITIQSRVGERGKESMITWMPNPLQLQSQYMLARREIESFLYGDLTNLQPIIMDSCSKKMQTLQLRNAIWDN